MLRHGTVTLTAPDDIYRLTSDTPFIPMNFSVRDGKKDDRSKNRERNSKKEGGGKVGLTLQGEKTSQTLSASMCMRRLPLTEKEKRLGRAFLYEVRCTIKLMDGQELKFSGDGHCTGCGSIIPARVKGKCSNEWKICITRDF